MNVLTKEESAATYSLPLIDDDIGIFRRIWRGRRWYGTEWYITVFGGLILVTVALMTLLAPIIAPYDPNEFVGAPLTPPLGGLQSALARVDDNPLAQGTNLAEFRIGVQRNHNSTNVAKALNLDYERYQTSMEKYDALNNSEVDLIFVDDRQAEQILDEFPQFKLAASGFGNRYWLGTDNLGRDITSRLVWGARTILGVAMLSAVLSSSIGIPLGLTSGFIGGKFDRALSLTMDSIYSFPGLLLAVALAAMLGPSLLNVAIAISVVYVPTFFRVVRGQVLSIKENQYVEAAYSLGARRGSIMFRYIFPNVIPSVVVVFSLNIADAIITEAGLSFIGLGLPPDVPDWGYDLNKGHAFLVSGQWWMITFPGILITLVAAGFSLLGEGLSEILNPRLTKN